MFVLAREDVEAVLNAHAVEPTTELVDWVFEEAKARVETKASAFETKGYDLDVALAEVEDFYFEQKVFFGNKRFWNPQQDVS